MKFLEFIPDSIFYINVLMVFVVYRRKIYIIKEYYCITNLISYIFFMSLQNGPTNIWIGITLQKSFSSSAINSLSLSRELMVVSKQHSVTIGISIYFTWRIIQHLTVFLKGVNLCNINLVICIKDLKYRLNILITYIQGHNVMMCLSTFGHRWAWEAFKISNHKMYNYINRMTRLWICQFMLLFDRVVMDKWW